MERRVIQNDADTHTQKKKKKHVEPYITSGMEIDPTINIHAYKGTRFHKLPLITIPLSSSLSLKKKKQFAFDEFAVGRGSHRSSTGALNRAVSLTPLHRQTHTWVD